MRLRQRITWVLTAVTATTLGGAFLAIGAMYRQQRGAQLDAELLMLAHLEAAEARQFGYAFSDRPGPARADVGPLTRYGLIFDERGAVLAATYPFDQRAPPPEARTLRKSQPTSLRVADMRLRAVIIDIPQSHGKELLLAASTDELDKAIWTLAEVMFLVYFLAVTSVYLVARWTVVRLIRDQERIASVARRVAKGDLTARVGISSADVEVEQLGRDIDGMIATMEELLLSRERFAVHAAHELRSPLARLYGELQLALRRTRTPEEYQSAIQKAVDAARSLKQLVDDLLTLARLPHELQSDSDACPVDPAIAAMVSECTPLANEVGVVLRQHCEASSARCRAGDLQRTLRNLIQNALHHAKSEVSVSGRASGEVVVIDVADDGPGVGVADRERIFEPFFRSRHSRSPRNEGAGLGLAISRQYAQRNGGSLELLALESPGSVFRLTLPRVVGEGSVSDQQGRGTAETAHCPPA